MSAVEVPVPDLEVGDLVTLCVRSTSALATSVVPLDFEEPVLLVRRPVVHGAAAEMWAQAVGEQDDPTMAQLLAPVHDERWPARWVPPAVVGEHSVTRVVDGRVLLARVTVARQGDDLVVVLAELHDRTGEGHPPPDGW